MKRIYVYIALVMLFFASCGDDFFEVDRDFYPMDYMTDSRGGVLQGLNGVYDMMYPLKRDQGTGGPSDIANNWNFKPMMAFSNYPARDASADGWDYMVGQHDWTSTFYMLNPAWQWLYQSIDRSNRFLATLSTEVGPDIISQEEEEIISAQARAVRSFFYSYLAQNWGRIPMLAEGESYFNSPMKARAATVEETWEFVVEDFKFAADKLDWGPWQEEYGRITKGMAKAYLGQAYMYLKKYDLAKKEFEDIIYAEVDGQSVYELEPTYANIHKVGQSWGKESIWEVSFPKWSNMSSTVETTTDAVMWWSVMTANADNGGRGAMYVSFEYANSFEPGDKRKVYTVLQPGQRNPYLAADAKATPLRDTLLWMTGDKVPNNACIKYWKTLAGAASTQDYYTAVSAVWKRLSAIYLDYAECLFRLNTTDPDGRDGWYYVNKIRERGWGEMETTVPFGTVGATGDPRPDAQTFYENSTHYQKYYAAPYSKPSWLVAITTERRHEFLSEYSFWYDLTRTEMAEAHVNIEYPIGDRFEWTKTYVDEKGRDRISPINLTELPKFVWGRTWVYNKNKELYPIPIEEVTINTAIGPANQNPGY